MKRKTASALIVLLLMSASLIAAAIGVAAADAGTEISGIIGQDTTWTPQGSPYVLVDTITVTKGVTLTILPGTVVNLKLASFIIEGTLHAQGNEADRIIIQAEKRLTYSWPPRIFFNSSSTPWDENTGTGCIIDYAQINVPTFQYEAILGGNPKISNNIVFNYGNDAAAIRTNGLVINNIVMGGYRGIDAENGSIYFNVVKDASVGISCGFGSPDPIYHPTIIGNRLINNSIGIEDWGSHLNITNNTIVNNEVGIRFTSYTFYRGTERKDLTYNNIYGNNHAVLVEFESAPKLVNMTYNWWGTTDVSVITQSICDNSTDSTQTKVDYRPFLNEPNLQAGPDASLPVPSFSPPNPSSTATPTPTPTLGPNKFNIESNSTISALSFNATSSEISFTVNGTSGTTGYVKATISKTLMPNNENIKVYLDQNPINCTITSNGDSWEITFTYNHSSHQVKINQVAENTAASLFESEYIIYIAVAVIAALLGLLGLLVWLSKSKSSNPT